MPKEKHDREKLSKSVLEMKFMKRSKLRVEAEEEAMEGSSMYSKNISEGMKNAVEKYIFEDSYIPFENLLNGRMSFGGMNPEIEKLMIVKKGKIIPVNREMKKDITDEEMAKFATLSQTIAKKFSKLSKRQRGKIKFKKPKDD